MRIALFCATRRGLRFLEKLHALAPQAELVVCSFREEPHEPAFLDDIRKFCARTGAKFFETKQAGSATMMEFWQSNPIDLSFAVSWRYMIPADVYRRAGKGSFVFHDSLLPKYRGFAPTVWAIVNGEDHTGATLFEMTDRVDDGDIVGQQSVPISQTDTIADLLERVTQAYLSLLEQNIQGLMAGTAPRRKQDASAATYCCKRLPEDNRIDWTRPAREVHNLIRATTRPYPGASTTLDGKKLIVWSASIAQATPQYVGRIPGRVVEISKAGGVTVLAGDGAVTINTVQLEGQSEQPAVQVVNKLSYTLGR